MFRKALPMLISSRAFPPILSKPVIKETIFSQMHIFGAFVKNQMAKAMWIYFCIFYSIQLIYLFTQNYSIDCLSNSQ
jgi:hypothetical protein